MSDPASRLPQDGRFVAGRSGNPDGRSKAQRAVMDALKGDGPEARLKMLELMRGDDLKVAYQAATKILEYAVGKPPDAPEDRESREGSVAALLSALASSPPAPKDP